jgi:serine phosphatase RsbU (regulator of sigma subunit)
MTSVGRPAPADVLVLAVDGMVHPLFVLDDQWRFRYINPAGAQLLGRAVPELVGTVVWEEFPEAVGSPFERHYRQVAETGVPAGFEAWFDPLQTWFRVDAVRTGAGVVVTYHDVTAQHEVERAREEAVAARELAGRHLMLLGDISQAMTSTLDTDEAVQRFAQLVVPQLGDWCLVTVVENGRRRDVGRAHRDPSMVEAMHRYADLRVSTNRASAPVPTSLRQGTPVVIQDLTDDGLAAMVSPDALGAARVLAPRAVATFPLIARDELFGAITLVNGPDRGPFTATELSTAGIASRRAALALDNARLATAQSRVAERLQRSLLSPPVQPDNLQLAVRYRPATQDVSIGGDWYDAFLQPDGSTVLVIGDVMGHDLEAAAVMGQLKTLVRAIAYDRRDAPADVMRRVDLAVVGLGVATLATALVARIEQDDDDRAAGLRRIRWTSAGHPMPMLLLADGRVVDLDSPVGPPLGIGWSGARADGVTLLPADSTLLLFTDGLFERRTGNLDIGRERLRLAVAELAAEPLEELCDGLLAALLADGAEDDVALLAVRAHPVGADRPAIAGPRSTPVELPTLG